MEELNREHQEVSLCGLNCQLCVMNIGGYCPGCGGGAGFSPCAIFRCAKSRGRFEFCFECPDFPCRYYQQSEQFNTFIVHRNQNANLAKIQNQGITSYLEQLQQKRMLHQFVW